MSGKGKNKSYPFWLGGVAASMAACCTHPLDFMRVHLQTTTQRTTLVNGIKEVVHQSGVRGLYTGLSASLFRQLTYSLVRLGAYEGLKAQISKQGTKKLSTLDLILCAGGAGAAGAWAGNPADILLVRMVSDRNKPLDKQYRYSNALTGTYRMAREEGLQSLLRGIGPNTVRAIIMNSSQLASYDIFKALILSNSLMSEGMPLHFVSSALAGTVATTISAPADVVRSRIMNAHGKQGVVELITTSLRQEGPRFLFKGWLPAWIRLTPNTILMFMFLEQLRKGIDLWRADEKSVIETV